LSGLVVATILFVPGKVNAQSHIVFSDLGAGNAYACCSANAAAGSAYPIGILETAASFVPTQNVVLDQIDLALGSIPGWSDSVTISITTDNGGLPGSELVSWNASGFPQFSTTSNTIQTFVPSTSVLLASNTTYWILEAPAAENTYATWNVPVGSFATGTFTDFYQTGSGWRTNNPSAPNNFGVPSVAFDVLGTAVPEPSAFGLAGILCVLGIGASGVTKHRRLR